MSNSTESDKDPRKPIFERVDEFKKNFASESDRACVVLIAARLDELIHQALSAHLLPPPTRDDNLLDSDRALGTFSARIDACYRLGLIDAEFCRALHLIRRIRNEFAHETSDSSLEQSPHRDRILQLAAPVMYLKEFDLVLGKEFAKEPHCRGLFSVCAWIMVLRLERVVFQARRISSNPVTFIPKAWQKTLSQTPEPQPVAAPASVKLEPPQSKA